MEIIPRVYRISGLVVNCFLVDEPDGLTLIDTGLASYEAKIVKTIRSLGRSVTDLKRILLTHSDGDHAGSLAALKAASGAQVYASAIEAQALEAGVPSRRPRFNAVGRLLARLAQNFFQFTPCKVDVVLTPGQDLPVLERLWVVPTPGHTPGHISFYSASARILFAGDSLYPVRDELVTMPGPVTWNAVEAAESRRLQAAMRPRIVCCGHGQVVRNAASKFSV